MKKNACFAGFAAALIFAAALTACSSGEDEIPVFDNPTLGIMSEATAMSIFDYEFLPSGGVRIKQFRSASALRAYLATPTASISARSGIARAAVPPSSTLFLCKIGDRNIVAIAGGAFAPTPGNPDTDVTTAVAVIRLAPTITAIAADSFSGNFSSIPQLNIPQEVLDLLPADVRQALGNSVMLVEVSAYSAPAYEIYDRFPGTLTIDELHTAHGIPPYAVDKCEGMAIYLDENLTREITGSTAITKNTRLYVSAEGVIPEITSYPGLDTTTTWPQDQQLNQLYGGGTLYFRTSANGKALLCNSFGRGDGRGTLIPDIWLLEEAGAGAFPVGTWIHLNGDDAEKMIFTATTLIVDSRRNDTYQYDYTVSGDTFVCTNQTLIPYIPTAGDLAEIAAFSETAYRASHPWIPDTSTITPTPTKEGIQCKVEDNPVMTFIDDPAVRGGAWTRIDYVTIPEWFDPSDLDDRGWLDSLEFIANGDLKVNDYMNPAEKWTKNLMKWVDGISGTAAPKYEIRTIGGTVYLFVENKSGDYSLRGRKPSWFVLTR
jgi:hypothetical protein